SAVRAGYLRDPFVSYFVRGRPPAGRSPQLNRGTYARCVAVDASVRGFLRSATAAAAAAGAQPGDAPPAQIVVLGCGSDSRYFVLKSEGQLRGAHVFEIDYAEVTARKCQTVRRQRALSALVGDARVGGFVYSFLPF
ncbi:Leucine carboxyl methyltransferase 2, partial [Cladochytrium tenue]